MQGNDFEKLKNILAAALEVPAGERTAFVHGACSGDPMLERQVLELLAAGPTESDSDDATPSPLEFASTSDTVQLSTETGILKPDTSEATGSPLTISAEELARLHPVTARFELLGVFGQGAMGRVYKARDRETGEIVALKVLRSSLFDEDSRLRRFKSEVRLARKITHKHVCRTHEFHRFDDIAAISMEYIVGEDLRTVLDRYGPISHHRAVVWAKQICLALEAAHAQGIIHRDLKPRNVMIDAVGDLKVMDFGISRSIDTTETEGGRIAGTPSYMAPEQVLGNKLDYRVDIHALGLILYEMLAGCAPFEAETPEGHFQQLLHSKPPSLRSRDSHLPSRLVSVVERCLAKKPSDRLERVSEVMAALEARDTSQPLVLAPANPAALLRPRRTDLVLLAIGLVALFATPRFWTFYRPEAKLEYQLSRSDAELRAREICAELEITIEGSLRAEYEIDDGPYDYLCEKYGQERAMGLIAERHGLFGYDVVLERGNARLYGLTRLDHLGSVRSVFDWSRTFAPADAAQLERNEAKSLARAFLADRFASIPAREELTYSNLSERDGTNVWSLSWTRVDTTGLEQVFSATVDTRIRGFRVRWRVPRSTEIEPPRHPLTTEAKSPWFPPLHGTFWGGAIGLAFLVTLTRRLWRTLTPRQVSFLGCGGALIAVGLAVLMDDGSLPENLTFIPLATLVFGIALTILRLALALFLAQGHPESMVNLQRFFLGARDWSVLGLALVRGIASAVVIVMLRGAAYWLAVKAGYTWYRPETIETLLNAQSQWIYVVLVGVIEALIIVSFLALTSFAFRKLPYRTLSICLLTAVVWAGVGGSPRGFESGADLSSAVIGAMTIALICLVFLRYELITVLVCAATLTMIELGGPLALFGGLQDELSTSVPFYLLSGLFLLGLAFGFGEYWRSIGARLGSVFD